MAYTAEISRSSPTALLLIIDQSTSMNHRLVTGRTKAEFVADVLNKTLYTLITHCSKSDGVRDYFDVGVVAYSGHEARNGFAGSLASHLLHPISRLAAAPLRIETRMRTVAGPAGDTIQQPTKFPVWFEPRSQGKTSMCAGLRLATEDAATCHVLPFSCHDSQWQVGHF